MFENRKVGLHYHYKLQPLCVVNFISGGLVCFYTADGLRRPFKAIFDIF